MKKSYQGDLFQKGGFPKKEVNTKGALRIRAGVHHGPVLRRVKWPRPMFQVDAILLKESLVDRDAPPMPCQGERAHVGDH